MCCRDHFSHYGEIAECVVMMDKDSTRAERLQLLEAVFQLGYFLFGGLETTYGYGSKLDH